MAKKKVAAATGAVAAARSNPYVQRLLQDEELRDNVRVAFESAREAYGRINNGKSATKVVTDDKKFQRNVQTAAEALKEAGIALKEGPKKPKRKGGIFRKLLLVVVAGGIALAVSSDLRSKVLDLLFGAEEEFVYSSTTTPSAAGPTISG